MNIEDIIRESINTKQTFLADKSNIEKIQQIADLCIDTLIKDGKILLCGNGGSASDAQHIAAELSGRYQFDRPPLYAEALHVNTSYVTAVANDYGYNKVYSRMVEAAGKAGDVLIGISTSGNSANVIEAINKANKLGMHTFGLSGKGGGLLEEKSDINIQVSSKNTARVQETHILIGHIICEIIENRMFPR